ncbi:hypothetical protein DOTSEDRAFT_41978 [Dothistroma septosporum NZE10]|uniref:PH domain-containing protein n=1 Tax=Dothistroma septosporum (strain NZE10 / CBS 128990) TaxID=675120 RepID=N1PXA9_DOTSN|nr:hypothetical protein DOTSEDRAFT_41978 [Dothistroma septosporum NZE10]
MDTPAETRTRNASNTRSQTTLDGPYPDLRSKRKSLRLRPTEDSDRQHVAEPPSPLKENRPELRRAGSSKMSLFNLFSKPKVEKLRGYAESGFDVPPVPLRAMSNVDAMVSRTDVVVRIQSVDSLPSRARPTSSKSYAARSARHTPTEAPPSLIRSFDPPSLFKVWPQATKHGVLEVSTMSPEMVLSKPARGRISSGFFTPHAEPLSLNIASHRGNVESRTAVIPTVNHAASGSLANHNIPKKLVVLVTSGVLLQYSETGANDRMPEKVLQLGKDSAAYASDLIPGRHHVLQIAQQVDQYGSMPSSHHSLLSRFSLRNHAARRTTNNLLLVMPDAQELGEWMSVIRKEIEIQGGKRARSTSGASCSSKPVHGDSTKLELTKALSQSRRCQIKRSPEGPATITNPSSDRSEPLPSHSSGQVQSQKKGPLDTTRAKVTEIDLLASPGAEARPSRPRATSDTASDGSSTAVSVDQQNLDKLRNSARQSHTSTVATSVTGASRTNSMSSSPPPEKARDSPDVPFKSPVRSLSSYSLVNRRLAAIPSLRGVPTLPATKSDSITTAVQQMADSVGSALDFPVTGRDPPLMEPTTLLTKDRLSVTQSVPNLKARSIEDAGRNSKFRPPCAANVRPRPESFLADLPDPSAWSVKATVIAHTVPVYGALGTKATRTAADGSVPTYSHQSRPLRSGANSFSLPLRVNPISPIPAHPQRLVDRSGHRLLSPIPAVQCLTAKVEFTALPKMQRKPVPSGVEGASPIHVCPKPARSTTARLSLFPKAFMTPHAAMPPQVEAVRRSSSAHALAAYAQPQATNAKLARPNSLQIRTICAPVLTSKRNAGPTPAQPRLTPTMPIRSLKPSRSVVITEASPSTVPEEPFSFATEKLQDEASDKATPLPSTPPEGALPPLSGFRPPSRTRNITRKSSRTSLPDMCFGIPLAGLGPPAPPPQAPVPEIPSGSRPSSRHTNSRLSMTRSGTPIGVASGDFQDERMVRSPSPAVMGLGIQVGGAN